MEVGMQRFRQLKVSPQVRENKTVKAGSLELIAPAHVYTRSIEAIEATPWRSRVGGYLGFGEAEGDNAGIYQGVANGMPLFGFEAGNSKVLLLIGCFKS
jgi:hypothetical protein